MFETLRGKYPVTTTNPPPDAGPRLVEIPVIKESCTGSGIITGVAGEITKSTPETVAVSPKASVTKIEIE